MVRIDHECTVWFCYLDENKISGIGIIVIGIKSGISLVGIVMINAADCNQAFRFIRKRLNDLRFTEKIALHDLNSQGLQFIKKLFRIDCYCNNLYVEGIGYGF